MKRVTIESGEETTRIFLQVEKTEESILAFLRSRNLGTVTVDDVPDSERAECGRSAEEKNRAILLLLQWKRTTDNR